MYKFHWKNHNQVSLGKEIKSKDGT